MEPKLFILPDTEAAAVGDADVERNSTGTSGDQATPPVVEFSPPPRWRLDDRTRAIGRQGIARARAALQAATQAAAEQDRSAA